MISIRGGSGLGDSIYVQSIARHFVMCGYRPEVCSDWPDVFRPLGRAVDISPFRKTKVDRLATYSLRRGVAGTDQFQDCCIQAGIKEPIELWLDWAEYGPFADALRHAGKPVICVQMPRAPFGRSDGFGMEFLPDCSAIQRAIDRLRGRATLVLIGSGQPLFAFGGIDIDLTNKTSVAELLDVANVAHGFLGYCSFIVPLAEALSKPALLVWSRRGLNSLHEVIRRMTPQKIIHLASCRHVIDDCSEQELRYSVDALCDQIGNCRPV